MKAWHFVGDTLRDGSPIPPDGERLEHTGPLVMCESGLHASKRLIDALPYAPGSTICRVKLEGPFGKLGGHDDKIVAAFRTILWRIDGESVLRDFARRCALDVIDLWNAPEVVVRYLKTGDEALRDAARAAGRDAARAAGWATAWDAAGAAGWAAGRDAARAAGWAAARAAGWAAGRDAARAAAWDAARDTQNRRLTSMVIAKARGGS